ncbi:MAG: NAD(P)/FAD-dependent oxidoreductase [Myxococcota bacterium]|nr:NAD(P)/FAD-dependent oxidoreductase [Myxococcota bacterium]
MTSVYDCVIVGGRCAGAPLARFLARAGKRVVVVDAAALPSDQPLSTHFIHPYGMRILDELGLGERVRAIAPSIDTFRTGIGADVVALRFPPGQGGSCPRRIDLDAVLLDGAREAGAEIRVRCRVVDVIREGERVVGVIVDDGGTRRELRADVVIGADGRHSTIAKRVGADEYNAYDSPRCVYWAYWPRPSWYATDPRYEGGTLIAYDDDDLRIVFPTNRDQLLIGFGFPATDDVAAFRADPRGQLEAVLRAHPLTAPLVAGAPLTRPIGIVKARFYFRRAAGPGWALVGDAGLFKDPSPGLGIGDALRDARALAAAIVEGGDAALERYWRERDVASLPLFYFARDLGDPAYNNAFTRLCYQRLLAEPAQCARLLDVIERRVSPYEVFGVGTILRWTFGAVLRGNFAVLGPFFKAGQVGAQVAKALKQCRQLVPAPRALGSAR